MDKPEAEEAAKEEVKADDNNATSVMEVDTDNETGVGDSPGSAVKVDDNPTKDSSEGNKELKVEGTSGEGNDDASFVVLEEDDGDEDEDEEDNESKTLQIDEGGKVEEEERKSNEGKALGVDEVVKMEDADSKENAKDKGVRNNEEVKVDSSAVNPGPDVLVNPLFGKPTGKVSIVPLISIETDDSSSNDDEVDYTEDVNIDNFHGNSEATDEKGGTDPAWTGGPQMPNQLQASACGCNCSQEKGILISEIERLRKAVYELNERYSVVEDYVEVEFGDSFEKYLKNREHLVQMGFGASNASDEITGKRNAKSTELVELLKMIKEQASENTATESEGKSNSPKKQSSSSSGGGSGQGQRPSFQNRNDRKGGGGDRDRDRNRNTTSRPKPIPSLLDVSPRMNPNTTPVGRGGILPYGHSAGARPVILSPNANTVTANEYLQQQLLAQQQAQAQLQYYSNFDSAYAKVIAGGPQYGGRDRDRITAVQRNNVYSAAEGYGAGVPRGGSGGLGGGYKSQKPFEPPQLSKKQRKRKRKSEVSSEASVSSTTGASDKGGSTKPAQTTQSQEQKPKVPASTKKGDDDDVVVIDFERDSNPQSKRICPVCSKIFNKKSLRDHLIVVHQNQRLECPVCKEECFQRGRLKTHMKNVHDLPASEYNAYLEHMYQKINLKIGPWVDSMLKEAKVPTLDQLIDQTLKVENESGQSQSQKPQSSGSNQPKKNNSNGSSNSKPTPSARADRGSHSRSGSTSTAANSSSRVRYYNPSGSSKPPSASDMYGPGGYAQYAAEYLKRSAGGSGGNSGSGRLYTPF